MKSLLTVIVGFIKSVFSPCYIYLLSINVSIITTIIRHSSFSFSDGRNVSVIMYILNIANTFCYILSNSKTDVIFHLC